MEMVVSPKSNLALQGSGVLRRRYPISVNSHSLSRSTTSSPSKQRKNSNQPIALEKGIELKPNTQDYEDYSEFNVIEEQEIPESCEPVLNSFTLLPPNNKFKWEISIQDISDHDECVDKILSATNYPRIKSSRKKQPFYLTGDKTFTKTDIFKKKLWTLTFWLLDNALTEPTWKSLAYYEAASQGQLNIVKFLWRKHYEDIHEYDGQALHMAARNGHLPVVKFLVFKGVNMHADNYPALAQAVNRGHFKIVKFLISKGANIHADFDLAFRTAVHYGRLPIVKFLISKGANIHAIKDDPLFEATYHGYLEIVKVLMNEAEKSKKPYEQRNIKQALDRTSSILIQNYLKSFM